MKGSFALACAALIVAGCGSPKTGGTTTSDPYVRAKALGLHTDLTYLSQRTVPEGTDAAPLYEKYAPDYSLETKTAIRDYLGGYSGREEFAPVLENLDFSGIEAITSRPNFVLRSDWSKPIEWLLPELGQTTDMRSALCARALYRVQGDRTTKAAEDIRRVATLLEHLRQYGIAIAQLKRTASLGSLARTAERIATELSDRPQELQLILDEISAIPEPEDLDTIRNEIALARGYIGQLRRGDLSLEDFSGSSLGGTSGPPNPIDVARIDEYGDEIERYVASLYVRCAEVWQDPGRLAAVYEDIESELESTDSDDYETVLTKTIAMIVLPFMTTLQRVEDRQRAYLRTMRIGVAATIMRERDGDWPTLDQAAKYAGTSLQDPFGDRLRYKAKGSKLLVYSVGEDGTDEGGARTRENREDPYDFAVFEVTVR